MKTSTLGLSKKVSHIAKDALAKLEALNIPPYPKYYHDAFMEVLQQPCNLEIRDSFYEYNDLFTYPSNQSRHESHYVDIAQKGLHEFSQRNKILKDISNSNAVFIDALKKVYTEVEIGHILEAFDTFQAQILQELHKADETIALLKDDVKRLERESNIDPLTNVFNRKALFEDLEAILQHGHTHDLDMVLAVFDVDDFKNVNDSLGHIVGDKILIRISQLIQDSLRKGTKVYRYGGEEFVVIFNRITLKGACEIVDRVLKKIDSAKLLHKECGIPLTLSAGICSHTKNILIEDFFNKADKALYDAKINGKNCYKVGY